MALFTKKTWKDRLSEYPTRRKLTKENGTTELVTVARSEGTISQEGDAFSAKNMNDLETRIQKAIGSGDIPAALGTDIISAISTLNTGIANMARLTTCSSTTSFVAATGITDTTQLPYILDSKVVANISSYSNGKIVNLVNGAASYQGIMFMNNINYWSILFAGYALGGQIVVAVYQNGTRRYIIYH